MKKIKVSGEERAPRICIVESNQELCKKIGEAFSNVGYVVSSAANGVEAIEHIYTTHPDIALVKLSLSDISGDIVIMQLKRMAKTQGIKFVLFAEDAAEKTLILDKISKKEGIDLFVQYWSIQQLVNTANELLKV